MRKLFTISLLLACFIGVSQSHEAFIKTIKAKYSNVKALHARIHVLGDGMSEKMEVWYNGENSLLKTNSLEMLLNPSCYLVVDKENSQINYQARIDSQVSDFAQQYQVPMDSLLKMATKVQVDTLEDNLLALQMLLNHPLLESVQFTFDLQLNLKGSIYRFDQTNLVGQPPMELTYELFETDPEFDKDRFNSNKYVKLAGEELRPAERFKGFQVNEVEMQMLGN